MKLMVCKAENGTLAGPEPPAGTRERSNTEFPVIVVSPPRPILASEPLLRFNEDENKVISYMSASIIDGVTVRRAVTSSDFGK